MQLRLTLYKKYFYEILNGQKKIEYRSLSKYYDKRFTKQYESILFINGYGKHRPFMCIELKEIIKTERNYELYLGKIIEVGNVKEMNTEKGLFSEEKKIKL